MFSGGSVGRPGDRPDQGDRTGSTETPSSLGVPAVRVREAGCSLSRVLPTFLDTKPGNEAELVAHCTDELPVVGTHTRETPGNSLV